MKDPKHAMMLFKLALDDWYALNGMNNTKVFSDPVFGFHVQQTIEKLLKSWLCHIGKIYPKTHDLSLLLNLLKTSGEKIDPFWPLVEYNVYAVQSRYDYIPENEPLQRKRVIQQVKQLLREVQKILEIKI